MCFMKNWLNRFMSDHRQGAAEIRHFRNISQKQHTCKNHSTTKDTQEWMKWSFPANYCCECGCSGAFCASHKQSFLPLSPAIERDTLAGWDGWMEWRGAERSGALAVRQLTSRLVLHTSLMTSLTVLAQSTIFTMSSPTPVARQESRRVKYPLTFILFGRICRDIHALIHFSPSRPLSISCSLFSIELKSTYVCIYIFIDNI